MRKKLVVIVLAVVVIASLSVMTVVSPGKRRAPESDKIAVIYVDGVIMGGRGKGNVFAETGGTDYLIKQLHQARDDASVKAIVLRVNSPGGSATASQELGEEMKKVRAAGKLIVTSMADTAASGGYWLAACSDRIYANPSTLTGSIGVYIPYANLQGLYEKIGVQQEKIKSGPHKDILSPDRPLTSEERAIIQTMVDDLYEQFVAVVAEGRNMEPARVRQLADGRIYTGKQAHELGLVDELGNLYDAIDGTARLVGIQGRPVIKEFGKNSPWDMLIGTSSYLDIVQKLLIKPTEAQLPMTGPVAVPLKW